MLSTYAIKSFYSLFRPSYFQVLAEKSRKEEEEFTRVSSSLRISEAEEKPHHRHHRVNTESMMNHDPMKSITLSRAFNTLYNPNGSVMDANGGGGLVLEVDRPRRARSFASLPSMGSIMSPRRRMVSEL
jgi:hypothetical protein